MLYIYIGIVIILHIQKEHKMYLKILYQFPSQSCLLSFFPKEEFTWTLLPTVLRPIDTVHLIRISNGCSFHVQLRWAKIKFESQLCEQAYNAYSQDILHTYVLPWYLFSVHIPYPLCYEYLEGYVWDLCVSVWV